MQLLHFVSPFFGFRAHLEFLMNRNKIKRSERVEAMAYLKRKMRSNIGRSPIVNELDMRELGVPILQTLLTIPLNKVVRVRSVTSVCSSV